MKYIDHVVEILITGLLRMINKKENRMKLERTGRIELNIDILWNLFATLWIVDGRIYKTIEIIRKSYGEKIIFFFHADILFMVWFHNPAKNINKVYSFGKEERFEKLLQTIRIWRGLYQFDHWIILGSRPWGIELPLYNSSAQDLIDHLRVKKK